MGRTKGSRNKKTLAKLAEQTQHIQVDEDNPSVGSPQHFQRLKIAQEQEQIAKRGKAVDSWYSVKGTKILKYTKKASGNVTSTYVASTKQKDGAIFLKQLKEEGKVRE